MVIWRNWLSMEYCRPLLALNLPSQTNLRDSESDFGAVVDTADLAKEMACLHKVRGIAGEQPTSLRARLPDPHPYHKMTSLKAKIPIVGKSDDPESSKFLNQSGDANANSSM